METSGFFNSSGGDRKYLAEAFARYFSAFIGNGVYPNPSTGLQVRQADLPDLTVVLPKGRAFIKGYFYENDADKVFTIDTPHASLGRKDSIFIRLDYAQRKIYSYKVTGTPSADPTPPVVTRNGSYEDLLVAVIVVNPGITQITDSLIIDCRYDSEVCGIVSQVVNQIDTTTLYKQIQKDLEEFKSVSQQEFNSWFEAINAKLGTEPATSLQSQVDDIVDGTMPVQKATEAVKAQNANTLLNRDGGEQRTGDWYMPPGSILAYAGTEVPFGWLLCDGREVSRSSYPALFNVIGRTYGAGNGSTTFGLPDLRGRVAAGVNSQNTLASTAGADLKKITRSNLPNEKHGIEDNGYWIVDSTEKGGYTGKTLSFGSSRSDANRVESSSIGEGKDFDVRQATLYINYIIKY